MPDQQPPGQDMSYEDLLKAWNVQAPELSENEVKGTSTFYQRVEGEYTAILLHLEERWVDSDKKKVEKNTPGAKHYGIQYFAIASDPEGKVLNDNFTYNPEIPYGRCVFSQYITFDDDKQYQNIKIYANFFIDGVPQATIIQGDVRKEYKVIFKNVGFYYGFPLTFTLTKKISATKEAKQPFIPEGGLELKSHKLDKETYAKRKIIGDKLWASIEEKRKIEEDHRKANKKDKDSGAADFAPPSATEDELLNNYGV